MADPARENINSHYCITVNVAKPQQKRYQAWYRGGPSMWWRAIGPMCDSRSEALLRIEWDVFAHDR